MDIRLPEGFQELFIATFGEDAWQQYQDTLTQTHTRGLRVNSLRKTTSLPLQDPIPWTNDGYYLNVDSTIGNDPIHAAGGIYLQEPSAMAPVTVLAPEPSERILDLCAAPGGKTTQIGALMQQTGFLLANDANAERCTALTENVERMGLTNTAVANALPPNLTAAYEQFFDGILVDAPCSGEGLFRREPDAVNHWSFEQVLMNTKRQLEILEAAYQMLRPGGRLVYSTCTLNPLENEGVCAEFVARHPDLTVQPITLLAATPGLTPTDLQTAGRNHQGIDVFLASLSTAWDQVPTERTIRLLPYKGAGEGHFVALLYKEKSVAPERSQVGTASVSRTRHKAHKTADKSNLTALFSKFAKEVLTPDYHEWLEANRLLQPRGKILYALLPEAERVDVLLRPGLPLLKMEYDHAVPHHAFALALRPADTRREFRLGYGDERVLAYLKGLPIPCTGENGWRLVTVDGLPLGWGKAVNGTLKNHYPKGLRRNYAFAWGITGCPFLSH